MISTKKNDHFLALTGVRAIAAYMIYLHHSDYLIKNHFGQKAYDIVKELHIGVTLFFVLSGFLIAYRYLDLKNFAFKNYMVNRIARIYPMYFILTTITFLIFKIYHSDGTNYSLGAYLLNITFLRGFFKDFIFSGIPQGWTLTVEETFYLIAPLFFFFIKRNKIYLILLPVCLLSFGLVLVLIFHNIPFFGFFSTFEFMMNGTFFGRCFEFFIGIGLAMVVKEKIFNIKFKYLTYIGLIIISLCVYLLSVIKTNYNLDTGNLHIYGIIINTLILPLFGISFFYYGLINENTFVSRILQTPLFVLLGKSSYIFYLIHLGVLPKIINRITQNNIIIFIILNVISILVFYFVEDPVNKYLRNKLVKKKTGFVLSNSN